MFAIARITRIQLSMLNNTNARIAIIMGLFATTSHQSLCDSPKPWQLGFQDPATPIMEGIADLHHDVMFLLVIICVSVLYLMVRVVILFHASRNNFSKITHGKVIEIVWTILPSLVLAVIAVPSFALLYSTDEVTDPAITIKAVGHQWYWSYEYSDYASKANSTETIAFDSYMVPQEDPTPGQLRSLEVDNPIYVPIDTHIRPSASSEDVLHCWTVPSFGVKIDACPGRLNQTSMYIRREGNYHGQCSEICGVNHGFMPIRVTAVALNDYIAWPLSQVDAVLKS